MKRLLVATLLLAGATTANGEFYTWKDGRGVAHYTNSIHEIPARYRQKARVLDVATGKLGGPATAQPGQTAPPTAPAGAPPSAATPLMPNGAAPPTAAGVPAAPAVAIPAATTAPAVPPAANPALPPPSRDAMRRMNRVRARTGQPEE